VLTPGNYPYTATTYSTISTDITSVSYGGFVNYGRQIILGNLLTLDAYAGVGMTTQSNSYSNKSYLSTINANGYSYGMDGGTRVSNYYGWARTPGLGISFTCGFRLGYIIPAQKEKKTKVTP
jgi:hypothetical protein